MISNSILDCAENKEAYALPVAEERDDREVYVHIYMHTHTNSLCHNPGHQSSSAIEVL
jgi:hypothetical protein